MNPLINLTLSSLSFEFFNVLCFSAANMLCTTVQASSVCSSIDSAADLSGNHFLSRPPNKSCISTSLSVISPTFCPLCFALKWAVIESQSRTQCRQIKQRYPLLIGIPSIGKSNSSVEFLNAIIVSRDHG